MNLKRILIIFCVVLLSFSVIFGVHAETSDNEKEVTILFTHDLHSHLLSFANESGDGVYGGCARIMTAITNRRLKTPMPFLLMPETFQWALSSKPPIQPRPLNCVCWEQWVLMLQPLEITSLIISNRD